MSPALRIKLFFALAALCLASAVRAQDGAYAVSGRVIDRLTRQPVAYAAVVPVGQEQRGASTDSLGRFRLERVRAGIFRLSASSVGYKTVVTPEYLVSAATPFIEIEMEEDATQLEAVTVVPSPFRATAESATERIQQIYAEPIKPELIVERLHEIRDAGVTVAGALSPQRTQDYYSTVLEAGVDLFVIRGTVVSAEHVSQDHEPLNLKKFIYDLDVPVIVGGAANYTAALHLMRTGAAGVLVGFGGGAVSANRNTIGVHAPMATAIADVAEARRDYMDESGGRYVQVIADGGMGDSGSFIKAFALGADAVMLGSPLARAEEAPGKGMHWGAEARHQTLPRGFRTNVGTVGTLEDIMFGPSHNADGTTNYIGALRRAMATTGYVDLKSFQRCPVTVAPTR